MHRLQPLDLGLGPLVVRRRPHTAPCSLTDTLTAGFTHGGKQRTWSCSHRGEQFTLEQVDTLILSRLHRMKSSFMVLDPDGTGLVTREEFRRVLEGLQPGFRKQLQPVIIQACQSSGEKVDYLQFLRSLRRPPWASRVTSCSSSSGVRRHPLDSPMSLSETQKLLQEQIGADLRNMIRAFHLFDHNRGGRIQKQELRRILDRYCIRLTDKEFQRLWSHYSPDDSSTISYEAFLEKLGFVDGHDFKISPVCTKLEMCRREKTPPDQIKQKKQTPKEMPHKTLQTLFHEKMCLNSTSLWRALQAFDAARSGLVTRGDLQAVLSSFIFPMNPHSFQKLTSSYGVGEIGPVRWKHFLGHFMSSRTGEEDTNVNVKRISTPPAHRENNFSFLDIYPQLKEIFHLLDQKEASWITRAELRRVLEGPGGTRILRPHRGRSQITELLKVLDPENTGVIHLTSLEKLKPDVTSSAPPDGPSAAETREVPKETKDPDQQAVSTKDPRPPTRQEPETSTGKEWCLVMDSGVEQKSSVEIQTTGKDDALCVSSASQRTEDFLQEKLDAAFEAPGLFDPQRSEILPEEDLKMLLNCQDSPDRLCNNLQVDPDTFNTLGAAFKKMKSKLEQRKSQMSSDGMLSENDLRKILEDCSVTLGKKDFNKFSDLLGLIDGRLQSSSLLQKHEEDVDGHKQQSSESQKDEKEEVDHLLTTAEQCLAALKTRIKSIHGDNLTAFLLMDSRHRGVVDRHDFKKLHDSLGFFCGEDEYERLLDLIGLHPGGNLNYAEFKVVVENNGKRKKETQAERVQKQLHDLLTSEARYNWTDMSKVLFQFDSDGGAWIHKNNLRRFLYTFSLPLTFVEFDQLWSSFDLEKHGRVKVCDFLKKLGIHHEQELETMKQRLDQTTTNQRGLQSTDSASLRETNTLKKSGSPPMSPNAVRHIESLVDLSPDAALKRLTELVTASAPDLYKVFSSFDHGRTGTVSALEFRQVLESFCARLSDKQFRFMLTKLELNPEDFTVNWKDFLNKFKTQRSSMECVRRNMPVNEQRLQKGGSQGRPGAHSMTMISKERGPHVQNIPLPLSKPRGSVSAGAVLQHTQCSSRRSVSARRPRTGSPAGSVKRRLRVAVQSCWREIQRSCRVKDPKREGVISQDCFMNILKAFSISLTQEQFEHLALKLDFMRNSNVLYQEFLQHFLLNLKPAETCTRFQRRKLPLPTQTSRGVLSKACVEVLLRIFNVVCSSRTSIRRCFLTSDRARTGSVSMQDFRKVLQDFSVDLSEEEFFHLSSFFDNNATGKICYDGFLWTFLH